MNVTQAPTTDLWKKMRFLLKKGRSSANSALREKRWIIVYLLDVTKSTRVAAQKNSRDDQLKVDILQELTVEFH